MSTGNVKCPVCGLPNRPPDPEKTDGWMECAHCGNAVRLMKYARAMRVPGRRRKGCQVLLPLPHEHP